ncbi:NAD(P)-dependent iron-only hydrogenase catalytic subunit [Selenomonas ruminantium]|uniref:NAD(P)-dependent iron-only hydrogenase catalytic subunit n=2 Tax=Selenomonas ruminantium TaxID=971 RepID=A0A1I3FP20_SELRU|nr:NAD(P)-dependent iron-only hydrogenase catalytic subunit [Selenomonas ruminantium]
MMTAENESKEIPMVHLTINNIPIEVPQGTKIMQAAAKLGIDIPHLCYHEDQRIKAHCRLCSVEVVGKRRLLAACSTEVWEGMEVHTDTQIVRDTQVSILQLMLANHHRDCLSCPRNQNCDLQRLCSRFNILESPLPSVVKEEPRIETNPSIVRDPAKCIRCGRCIRACKDVQGIAALTYAGRSSDIVVTTAFNKPMEATDCILCGQCSLVCPTGAIVEKDDTTKVLDALQDPQKHVIVQVAPSVRVALGDAFGLEPGAIVTGQMVTALKLLGFDRVFDTNFGADLTIMEEGAEFLDRLQNGGTLPMMTSCSPGWVNYMEKHFPDCIGHLSSAKSPMSMFGAIAKTYYAEKAGIDVKDIVTVSVMPCTAKKFEAARPEMGRNGQQDVDIVLTTRELIKLIKYVGLRLRQLPESDFDSPLGLASGAAAIFGTTGGVMEAALRTVYEKLTGQTLEKLAFNEVRGFEGIKECSVNINGREIRICVAHTLRNARRIMEQVQQGTSPYDFIEIMACPGGCIGGGGQPIGTTNAIRKKRMAALYEIDRSLPLRKSHDNPEIQTLYKEFLGEPLGEKAHELLHTTYHKVSKPYEF